MCYTFHYTHTHYSSRYIWWFSRCIKNTLLKWNPYRWDLKAWNVLFYKSTNATIFRIDRKFLRNWVMLEGFSWECMEWFSKAEWLQWLSKTTLFFNKRKWGKKALNTFCVWMLGMPKEVLKAISTAPQGVSVSHPFPTEFSILNRNAFIHKYRPFSVIL